MATYVNDLRLKEIGTGESSGTWGTETNVNLELIAEAFSYGTEAITTNADTHTTTIADGATDPGRSMYLKYTGTLDSACTITIGPNTVSKMWFIENGTSGSQNIIISQGSGANITIPPGDVKVVYSDGAGSGAAFFDAFASLNVVDLKVQDDLTVTDDLIVNGDIDLEGSIDVNGTANLDVVDIDGAVDMATTLAVAGNVDFNGDLDVDGTTNLDVVDIDGAVDMASTLQVDGAITSSAGATITLADNTDNLTLTTTDADASVGPNLRMYRNSGSPADNDLVGAIDFEGRNDNSQDVVYSQIFTQILDASDGTEDGYLSFKVMNAGTSRQRLLFDAGETVFNDESQDVDLRVESNGNANMLFVDAGNDAVGIGTTSPQGDLTISNAGAEGIEFFAASGGNINSTQHYNRSGSVYVTNKVIAADHQFNIAGNERLRIDSSGYILAGTTSNAAANKVGQVVAASGIITTKASITTTNGTADVTVPAGGIMITAQSGYSEDAAIFTFKADGGSQGVVGLGIGNSNWAFGTTSEPGGGQRNKVWVQATNTLRFKDNGYGARTYQLTILSNTN